MASSARATSPSKTRKARTTGMVQASTNLVIDAADDDNLIHRQVQRLVQTLGLTESRARVVATLCWEGQHHG